MFNNALDLTNREEFKQVNNQLFIYYSVFLSYNCNTLVQHANVYGEDSLQGGWNVMQSLQTGMYAEGGWEG